MTLSPLASSHCLSCGAFLLLGALGLPAGFAVGGVAVAANAVDAAAANVVDAATSVARMMLRMRMPPRSSFDRSVRIAQSDLKAERLLPARHRAERRQVALLDANGVAQVEQVE